MPGTEDYQEAQRLQALLALADGACQRIGVSCRCSLILQHEDLSDSSQIAGLKMLVHKVLGHSEVPRRPLLSMKEEEGDAMISDEAIGAVLAEEKQLAGGQ